MKKLIIGLTAASLCTLAPLPIFSQVAFAGPYDDAIVAYETQNYDKAFHLLTALSNTGNNSAKFYLGKLYESGNGTPRDLERAQQLYKASYKSGNVEAKDDYVRLTLDGMQRRSIEAGIAPGTPEATRKRIVEHYMKRLRNVQIERARHKILVETVPVTDGISAYDANDFGRAFPILLAHAHKGVVEAQTRVGVMYRDGLGVAPSDTEAGQWFEKAEKGDSGEAYYHHAMLKFWGRYQGACCLMAEGLMERSYRLGYQPAIDRFNRKQAEKDRIARLQQERLQKEAEAAARRAERLRKNPRRTITNCDGPRPSDAPPVPTGYYCDRRSGSSTYGAYVREK